MKKVARVAKKVVDASIAQMQEIMSVTMREAAKVADMTSDEAIAFMQSETQALPNRRGKSRVATALRIATCAFKLAQPKGIEW